MSTSKGWATAGYCGSSGQGSDSPRRNTNKSSIRMGSKARHSATKRQACLQTLSVSASATGRTMCEMGQHINSEIICQFGALAVTWVGLGGALPYSMYISVPENLGRSLYHLINTYKV